MEQIFKIWSYRLYFSWNDKIMNLTKKTILSLLILSACTTYQTDKLKQTFAHVYFMLQNWVQTSVFLMDFK